MLVLFLLVAVVLFWELPLEFLLLFDPEDDLELELLVFFELPDERLLLLLLDPEDDLDCPDLSIFPF